MWLYYMIYGRCFSKTQNVIDDKRKCRRTQHPTESDSQGQIPISSLLQRELICKFQRRILHCLQSVCKQTFFQQKCIKMSHWITAFKESSAMFVLAELICPITSTLADVKPQGPHRISIYDIELLTFFFSFFFFF